MQGQHFSPIVIIVFVALFAFSLYRRYRRMVGRQPLVPWRLMLQVVLLALVSLLFLVPSLTQPASAAAGIGGLLAGGALGFVGLRHTRFERTPDRDYYTPNTYLGLAIFAIFLVRIAYRYVQIQPQIQALQVQAAQSSGPPPSALVGGLASSPLTTALLLMVFGYYLCYSSGLLLWVRRNPPGQAVHGSWGQPTGL